MSILIAGYADAIRLKLKQTKLNFWELWGLVQDEKRKVADLTQELEALKTTKLMESRTIAITASAKLPYRGINSSSKERYEIEERLNMEILSYIRDNIQIVELQGYSPTLRATCFVSHTSDDNIIDLGEV